jgi:hypothetical protein
LVKDGDIKSAVDTLPAVQGREPAGDPDRAFRKPADEFYSSTGIGILAIACRRSRQGNGRERDRFFHAMLKPLGIEKGKPFAPDDRQKKILTDAAELGFLTAQALSMAPRLANASSYKGTHWEWF